MKGTSTLTMTTNPAPEVVRPHACEFAAWGDGRATALTDGYWTFRLQPGWIENPTPRTPGRRRPPLAFAEYTIEGPDGVVLPQRWIETNGRWALTYDPLHRGPLPGYLEHVLLGGPAPE
jgi:hypothetical protein